MKVPEPLGQFLQSKGTVPSRIGDYTSRSCFLQVKQLKMMVSGASWDDEHHLSLDES